MFKHLYGQHIFFISFRLVPYNVFINLRIKKVQKVSNNITVGRVHLYSIRYKIKCYVPFLFLFLAFDIDYIHIYLILDSLTLIIF